MNDVQKGKKHPRPGGIIAWEATPLEQAVAGIERRRLDGQQMTLIRYTYDPGAHFPAHSHAEEQVTIVLAGAINFEIDGEITQAGPGDVIFIPGGKAHRAWVPGEEEVDTINVLAPRRTGAVTLLERE